MLFFFLGEINHYINWCIFKTYLINASDVKLAENRLARQFKTLSVLIHLEYSNGLCRIIKMFLSKLLKIFLLGLVEHGFVSPPCNRLIRYCYALRNREPTCRTRISVTACCQIFLSLRLFQWDVHWITKCWIDPFRSPTHAW